MMGQPNGSVTIGEPYTRYLRRKMIQTTMPGTRAYQEHLLNSIIELESELKRIQGEVWDIKEEMR